MKTNSFPPHSSLQPARLAKTLKFKRSAVGLSLLFFGATQAHAQIYWDGTGTTWNAVASWSTATAAVTPNPGAVPGVLDEAVFNISTVNTNQTVSLDANQSIRNLTFRSTGTTLLQGGGTNRTLSLYGNITLATGAGAVTIGNATSGQNASLSLFGSLSWTAAAGTTLTVPNTMTRSNGATISASSTGTFTGAGLLAAANTTVQGWLTSGNDWAISDGTNLVANSSNVDDTWAAGNNTTVTGDSAPSSGSTTHSLRFDSAAAATLTLAGTNTLTSGGIFLTSNVGNNATAITGGTLRGATGRDLVVIQNNTASAFTIGSVIANNGTATGLSKSGAGELILTNANTFTGAVNVNGGTLTLNSGASLTGLAASNLNGGSLRINSGASWSSAGLTSAVGSTMTIDGGSFTSSGNIGNAGNPSTTITLNLSSGSASFTGGINYALLNMSGGTISVSGSATDSYMGSSVISGGTYTNTSSNTAGVRSSAANSLTINGTGSYNVNKFSLQGNIGDHLKVDGGSMTVTGDTFYIGNHAFSGVRTAHVAQTGGTVTMANANGLVIGQASAAVSAGSLNDYRLSGGTLTLQKVTLAVPGYTGQLGTNAFKMSGGTLNLGSGGIVTGGGAGTKLIEISGGTIGATADWTSSLNMSLLTVGTGGLLNLGNGIATFRADDGTVTPAATNIGLSGNLTGAGSLAKTGVGVLTLSGTNTYAGATTISGGTLALGASGVLPDASAVSIGAGTLDAATFTETAGTLDPTAAATINLGSGGALAFANSSAVDWTGGTLNITGTFTPTSIRFGTTSGGLTAGQLALISVNGSGAGTYELDSSGYLVSGGSPYDTWATANGATGGTEADPDGDGLSNLQEFAFGTNPTASSGAIDYTGTTLTTPGAPKVVSAAGSYSMVFGQRADSEAAGLTYTVQFSGDLAAWADNDDEANPPVQIASDGTIHAMNVAYPDFILTSSGTQKPRFSRVKVVMAP
jgi:fibronectin-binding autotransporter adhesin